MGVIVLSILCIITLWFQIKNIQKVKISESYSRMHLIVVRVSAILFVVWGILFLQDLPFVFITILIAIILLLYPYTTGLGEKEIIYRPNISGFAPKTEKYTDIYDFTMNERGNQLKLILNIENKFKIRMHFTTEDREKVLQLLQSMY
jgi:hypothetical protein